MNMIMKQSSSRKNIFRHLINRRLTTSFVLIRFAMALAELLSKVGEYVIKLKIIKGSCCSINFRFVLLSFALMQK
jgi:hypothetical protein